MDVSTSIFAKWEVEPDIKGGERCKEAGQLQPTHIGHTFFTGWYCLSFPLQCPLSIARAPKFPIFKSFLSYQYTVFSFTWIKVFLGVIGIGLLFYAVQLQLKADSGVGIWLPLFWTQVCLCKGFLQNFRPISADPSDYVTEEGQQNKAKGQTTLRGDCSYSFHTLLVLV